MSKDNGKPRVYSYIRFSTPEQSMGDSERRQLDDAQGWAKRKGLELDDQSMIDRGLSGYHGDHRTKGALGRFLELVKTGAIPSGSILLVENVDRLSREGFVKTLRQIIFKLWDRGITLQTLSPEESYGPGCDNDPKFIALFLYLQVPRTNLSERANAFAPQENKPAKSPRFAVGQLKSPSKPAHC